MRIRFAGFTLDDERRQLLAHDEAVHVSPKAYELLKLLLEQRPKALSKAELHERLWPGTFVSEVNLAALVNEVRAALGERGRHGRFIRTVHGFGYAFAHEAVTDGGDGTAVRPAVPAGGGLECWLSWGARDYALRPGAQTIGRDLDADVRIDALSILAAARPPDVARRRGVDRGPGQQERDVGERREGRRTRAARGRRRSETRDDHAHLPQSQGAG